MVALKGENYGEPNHKGAVMKSSFGELYFIMTTERIPQPRSYAGVMVSSTFTDLKSHREALIKAINGQELKAVAMENDSAKPAGDVIDSSLQMVRDSAGYIGVISHKYGQIPECPQRNPNNLSLTELEFNEARRLNRHTLIFIMGDEHDVKPADVEREPEKIKRLEAFRESAKRISKNSSIHRIYKVFNSLHEFEIAATQSVAALRRVLEEQNGEFPPVNAGLGLSAAVVARGIARLYTCSMPVTTFG